MKTGKKIYIRRKEGCDWKIVRATKGQTRENHKKKAPQGNEEMANPGKREEI